MAQKRRLKVGIMVYIEPELLERIDAQAPDNRSAWIIAACREKLAREQRPERTETQK